MSLSRAAGEANLDRGGARPLLRGPAFGSTKERLYLAGESALRKTIRDSWDQPIPGLFALNRRSSRSAN
jgi:hypothetical protein